MGYNRVEPDKYRQDGRDGRDGKETRRNMKSNALASGRAKSNGGKQHPF